MNTGFFRVDIDNYKLKENYVSFRYRYSENCRSKSISNTSLKGLEEDVLSCGLEWKVVDKEKAYRTRLFDNSLTLLKDEYQENKIKIKEKIEDKEVCIQNLIKNQVKLLTEKNELLAEENNIKQIFLQEKNENISRYMEEMNQILSSQNPMKNQDDVYSQKMSQALTSTGFYLVSAEKRPKYKTASIVYRYKYQDKDGKRKTISSIDLDKLEQRVKARGLKWEIVDKEKANKTKKEWIDNKNKYVKDK